jgi:hypothetical protein
MIVRWHQQYEGSVQKGGLSVEEYSGRLFSIANSETESSSVHPIRPSRHCTTPTFLARASTDGRVEESRRVHCILNPREEARHAVHGNDWGARIVGTHGSDEPYRG